MRDIILQFSTNRIILNMNMRRTKASFLTLICLFIQITAMAGSYEVLYNKLPFDMPVIKKSVFPNYNVSIVSYGAIADGVTLNTNAINKAISDVSERGGGKVIIPSGIWLTGPIDLQSNVNLHLEYGALLLFSSDFNLYPLVQTVFEGLETRRCKSPITGQNLENIAITGKGAINGSGDAWRPLKKSKVTDGHWKKVKESGGILKDSQYWFPTQSSLLGENIGANSGKRELTEEEWLAVKDYLRPVMVSLVECKNVLLEGVLFENSPSWNIHPLMCENLIFDGIEVRNPSYSQNGDGLDIESCINAIVVNCSFDVGDDAICIKSGKDEDGRRRARPTENVIVNNCRVFKAHGGFVVGSEMSGSVRNISVTDCQFIGTNIGLRFKSARGRGGIVENIYIDNINMLDIVHEPLSFNLYYFTKQSDTVPSVDETTPIFKDITIKNITCRNANKAMFFNGIPEMNIQNIRIEDSVITSVYGAVLCETENVIFNNVHLNIREGAALILNNVKDFTASNFTYQGNTTDPFSFEGENSRNIIIQP